MMVAYASRTGTRRNLDALRHAGWRLMVSARGALRTEGFRYALDNGAWTSFQRGEPFDEIAFERAVALLGAGADWIVLPDIVMGGVESLEFSRTWLARLRNRRSLSSAKFMLAVQNGSTPGHIRDLIDPRVGIFVGGDTDWKLATMAEWARLARAQGALCHVGRVNSARRIRLCAAAGVHSFDGSGVSRFASALPPLDLARRQTDIEGWIALDSAKSTRSPMMPLVRCQMSGASSVTRQLSNEARQPAVKKKDLPTEPIVKLDIVEPTCAIVAESTSWMATTRLVGQNLARVTDDAEARDHE